DALGGLASDKSPAETPGDDAEGRKKCRAAWEAWWKANEGKVDLAKADVGLPWLSANQRARSVAMQFINALLKGDAKLLSSSTDVPFCMAGIMVLKTRQEFDQMLGQAILQAPQRPKIEFSPPQLMNPDDYLKSHAGE